MKVFVFDLVAYAEHLDHLRVDGQLPYPMEKKHFRPQIAVQTYREHLDAWVELERMGFDGVAFNEHHVTPYGLMNSPNLIAASAAQRTERLKLLMYGNLLPIHDPLRLAEEIAMLDCLSNGRIICGVARGAAREYRVFNVPLEESRARFDECYDILVGAWTSERFTFNGRFHSYKDVAIWPRPVQQPHPPVWMPVSRSKDSIEWAAAHDVPITPGIASGPAREDIVRYYARCLAEHGKRITPHHITITLDAYVADSTERAIEEYGPYALYFHNVLYNFDHVRLSDSGAYYSESAAQYLRPENRTAAFDDSNRVRDITMDEVVQQARNGPWGTPKRVADRIIAEAEHLGSDTVIVSMNRGAVPQEMFLNQIHRFGTEVLPILQRHEITRVPLAEAVG
ncbi:MAG TPA: LLM class flavin-dependent oxidoreductase [Stellaceae bacterium]|nr:LLM class flavin-dependent oxidoreductase [Stellaceae bacterium]